MKRELYNGLIRDRHLEPLLSSRISIVAQSSDDDYPVDLDGCYLPG